MAELRQWCPECEAATVTWVDSWAVSHCSRHEPEDGWRDPRDDNWDDDDD